MDKKMDTAGTRRDRVSMRPALSRVAGGMMMRPIVAAFILIGSLLLAPASFAADRLGRDYRKCISSWVAPESTHSFGFVRTCIALEIRQQETRRSTTYARLLPRASDDNMPRRKDISEFRRFWEDFRREYCARHPVYVGAANGYPMTVCELKLLLIEQIELEELFLPEPARITTTPPGLPLDLERLHRLARIP